MLKVGICCRDLAYGQKLEREVENWGKEKKIVVSVFCFSSGEEMLMEAEENGGFSVVLLDAKLEKDKSGAEIAEELRMKPGQNHFSLIYLGDDEYWHTRILNTHPSQVMVRAFLTKRKLHECLEAAAEDLKKRKIFSFKVKNSLYLVALSEIIYFTSDKRKIRLLKTDGLEYTFYGKLNELEEKIKDFSDSFHRIHQSYYVNREYIQSYHPRFVLLHNGEELPRSDWYKLK